MKRLSQNSVAENSTKCAHCVHMDISAQIVIEHMLYVYVVVY